MSDSAGSYPPQHPNPQPQSTTDVAREQAANVGQSASDAGSHVVQTATEQARKVSAETARQARDLMGEATGQVRDQASVQQQRAAHQLHSVADELHEMAAKGGQSGLATELAQQGAERLHGAASWLERREPADLLASVRDFARRRPGVFLAGAAIAGLAAGRLTRGMTAAANSGGEPAYEAGSIPGSGLTAADTPPTGYQSTAYRSTGYQDPAYPDPAYQGGTGQGAGGFAPAGTGLPAEGIPYPDGSGNREGSAYTEASPYPEAIAVPRVPGDVVDGGYPEDDIDEVTRVYPAARDYPQGRLNPESGAGGTSQNEPRRP